MRNLNMNPVEYVKAKIDYFSTQVSKLKVVNIILNIIIILSGFVTTVMTSLLLSKLFYSSYPDWFFYASAGLAAMTGLATSLLNFFVIQNNIKTYQANVNNIKGEFVAYGSRSKKIYQNKSDKQNSYHLFLSVAAISGSKPARKEMKNVGK